MPCSKLDIEHLLGQRPFRSCFLNMCHRLSDRPTEDAAVTKPDASLPKSLAQTWRGTSKRRPTVRNGQLGVIEATYPLAIFCTRVTYTHRVLFRVDMGLITWTDNPHSYEIFARAKQQVINVVSVHRFDFGSC